jgi:hypothetical protein
VTGYELDDRGSGARFPEKFRNFSLLHRVQTGSEAYQASNPVGTEGSFLGGKAGGRGEADHSPPSSAEVKECVELYLHSHLKSSWDGPLLSTGTTLLFSKISV